MNVLEAICSRRSIRKYNDKPVSEEQVQKLLKAAMFAPSARNQQPWHFIVIRNKKTLEGVRKFHPYAEMTKEAQVAILICADENLEKSKNYWPVDCSNATQNILLAAHGIGLGSVWLGIYPREERMKGCIDLFDLPSNIHPFALVSIGNHDMEIKQPNRYNEERIHYEQWFSLR